MTDYRPTKPTKQASQKLTETTRGGQLVPTDGSMPARITEPYLIVMRYASHLEKALDDSDDAEVVKGIKASLPLFDRTKALWIALDQPATVDQITAAAARLASQRDSINTEIFTSLLLTHFTAMEATGVEIDNCCFEVEKEDRFAHRLSIGDVWAAMKKVKRRAKQARYFYGRTNRECLERRLRNAEKNLTDDAEEERRQKPKLGKVSGSAADDTALDFLDGSDDDE